MEQYKLVLQTVDSLTGVATSVGLFIAYRQFRLATRQALATFEDALAREYRQVAHRLPVRALLGEPLPDDELERALVDFYWYFDLTNEQLHLCRHRRISDETWRNWREGIRAHMRKPAFAAAWRAVSDRAPHAFRELRALHGATQPPTCRRRTPRALPRRRRAAATRADPAPLQAGLTPGAEHAHAVDL